MTNKIYRLASRNDKNKKVYFINRFACGLQDFIEYLSSGIHDRDTERQSGVLLDILDNQVEYRVEHYKYEEIYCPSIMAYPTYKKTAIKLISIVDYALIEVTPEEVGKFQLNDYQDSDLVSELLKRGIREIRIPVYNETINMERVANE